MAAVRSPEHGKSMRRTEPRRLFEETAPRRAGCAAAELMTATLNVSGDVKLGTPWISLLFLFFAGIVARWNGEAALCVLGRGHVDRWVIFNRLAAVRSPLLGDWSSIASFRVFSVQASAKSDDSQRHCLPVNNKFQTFPSKCVFFSEVVWIKNLKTVLKALKVQCLHEVCKQNGSIS